MSEHFVRWPSFEHCFLGFCEVVDKKFKTVHVNYKAVLDNLVSYCLKKTNKSGSCHLSIT